MEALYRYPRGGEGFARLLIRSALAILLFSNESFVLFTETPSIISLIRIVVCLGLCVGLFTRFVGVITATLSVWALFWGHQNLPLVQVATLIDSIALAILGPGAYSIDAILLGRRRVIF